MKQVTRVFSVIALLMAGLSSMVFAQSARITQRIDESKLTIMRGNTRPEARVRANDRGPVSDSLDLDHILLQLQRSPEQEQAFTQLIDEMSNQRNSPNFHKWLTADEIGRRFGVSQEDLDTITGWLGAHNFRINQIYPATMVIDFGGTAGAVREAFHTSIHSIVDADGVAHIANMSDPTIPEALSPVVKAIVSLNSFMPKPMYIARTPEMTFAGCASSATLKTEPGTCYAMTANDTATEYSLTPLFTASPTPILGTGQTIAVIEDTDTYDTTGTGTEWTSYRNAFGLTTLGPSATYTEVHPSCTDPSHNGDDGEAAIDVEMATTTAPNAAIELISCASGNTTFGGLLALQGLVNGASPYPGVATISYGSAEGTNGNGGNLAFYNTYQTASAEGMTVFVSSGDDGPSSLEAGYSADPTYGDLAALSVTGWGETPYNVSVGGTDFEDVYNSKQINTYGGFSATVPLSTYWATSNTSTYGSAKQYVPEIPWNDSCASVLISEVVDGTFTSLTTCNATTYDTTAGYMSEAAASGGASNCALLNGGAESGGEGVVDPDCMGYAKPGFQSGASLNGGSAVYGQPTDQVRDIPDVSLFAANGTWGHYQTVCWNDPSYTVDGAHVCTGAPSTWSGFGGTSVAAPTMAGIQALVNQKTGENWGIGALTNYYQIGQTEYGTAGGTFSGSSCNANGNGGPGSSCVWNDVTQGDIDLPCFYNYSESDCYKSATTQTHGVNVTDTITAAAVIFGGSGYTSAPTCTIAGPNNNNPYTAPSGTVLYTGGSQATCTATTSTATTTAVWKATFVSGDQTLEEGQQIIVSGPTGASATTYTIPTCSSYTVCATDLNSAVTTTPNSWATAAVASNVVTFTAKAAGAAGNFVVGFGPAAIYGEEVIYIQNSTLGQGPNYVSGIAITAGGSGYGPDAPITISGGGGSGAVAVANTNFGTPPQTAAAGYQPSYGAAPGWDMATGLGSPNGNNLVNSSVWSAGSVITCTSVPASAGYGSSFTISCTTADGVAVSYYASSGGCSNSGATYTMTSPTTSCTITVAIAKGSPTMTYTVTATQGTDTMTWTTAPPASAVYGSNFTVLAAGVAGDTGAITYSSSGGCSNSGATFTMTSGTTACTVTANQASTTNYLAGSIAGSVTATLATNTVTWTTAPPSSAVYGSNFTVAASGLGTGAITYASGGGCTNSGATYTMTSGTTACSASATQAADSNYASGTVGPTSVPATLATNAVTFGTPAPSSAEYGSSFTVAASGLGTGAITYSSGGACSNSGATYTMTGGSSTCTVTATQAADSNYNSANASESVGEAVANSIVSVALTTGANPSTYGQSLTFTATITSDTGAVKGRRTIKKNPKVVTGTVTWSGNTSCGTTSVTSGYPGTATCTTTVLPGGSDTVYGVYSGDINHSNGTGSLAQTVSLAANTVTFSTPAPSSAEYGSSFTVAASGLGTGAMSYTSGGACSNSGATYTMTSGTGSCTVTATQAADSDYATANASESVTAEPAVGSVSVGLTSGANPSAYGGSVTFTATVTSDTGAVKGRKTTKRPKDLNGTVAWSGWATAATDCPTSGVSGNSPETATCTTSALPVGSDTVTATYTASDSNHTTGSGSVSQTVSPAAPSINVTNVSPGSEDYGSDGQVTITAQLTWSGSGTAPTAGNVSIGGNGPSSYGSTSCMTSGNTMTCQAKYYPNSEDVAGLYTETASFTADANYSAASSPQTNNFTINGATTTTNIGSNENPSNYGDTVTFTATIDPENGEVRGRRTTKRPKDVTGSVQWSANTGCGTTAVTWMDTYATATCMVSSLNAGGNTVTAQYLGDGSHSGSTGSLGQTVDQASQTILFTYVPAMARYQSTFTVTATGGGSGDSIVYTSSGVCTNSGANYTMTAGTGTCTVIANQAGNSNYTAAPQATSAVTAQPANQTITITTPAPASAYKGATFTVAATASSGLPVTYSNSGDNQCSNSGANYTITGTQGTCNVRYTQTGNSNYLAAPSTGNAVTIIKATKPTVSFTGAPGTATYSTSFTVTASSESSSVPTITATGSCSLSDTSASGTTVTSTVTMTKGTASCTLKADWAASDMYEATSATQKTAAAKLAPTVSLTGAPSSASDGDTFTVTATSNEAGTYAKAAKVTVLGGACKVGTTTSIGGGSYQATVTMTAASGTCTSKATWLGSDDYLAASSASEVTTAE